MLKEFREFAMRGSVIDLAVGVIIGAAFGKIVTSLVNDIIMPPIGIALGGVDFADLRVILKAAVGDDPATEVAIRYGAFLNAMLSFVIVAFVVFWISKMFLKEAPADEVKTCPFCKEANALDASRCKACTSEI